MPGGHIRDVDQTPRPRKRMNRCPMCRRPIRRVSAAGPGAISGTLGELPVPGAHFQCPERTSGILAELPDPENVGADTPLVHGAPLGGKLSTHTNFSYKAVFDPLPVVVAHFRGHHSIRHVKIFRKRHLDQLHRTTLNFRKF